MNIISVLEQEQLRSDIPAFRPGDTVKVHVKVVEGNRERIQVLKASSSAVRTAVSAKPSPFAAFPMA